MNIQIIYMNASHIPEVARISFFFSLLIQCKKEEIIYAKVHIKALCVKFVR